MRSIYNFLILVTFSCQFIGTAGATTYPVPYNQYNQSPYNTSQNQQTFSQNSNSSLNPFSRQKPLTEKKTSSQTSTGTCPRPSVTDDGGQGKLNKCGRGPSDESQIPQIVDYVNRMNDDLNQLKISYIPSILHNVDGLDGKLRKLELDLRRLSEDMGNAPSQTELKLLRGQIRDLKTRLNDMFASEPSSKADPDLENRLNDIENHLNYLKKRFASSEFKMPQQIDMNQISSIVENLVGQRLQIIDQRLNMMAQSQHIPAFPSPSASNTYEASLPPRNVDLSPVYREVEQLKGYLQKAFHEIRLLQQLPTKTTVQGGNYVKDLEKLRRYVDERINSLRQNFPTSGGEKPKSENEAKINYALNQINALMKKISDLEHHSQMTGSQGYKGPSQADIERTVKDITSMQIRDLRSKLKEELGTQKSLTEPDVRNIVTGILNNQNYKDIFEQIFSSKVSDITKLIQMEVSKVTTLSATDVKQMIDQAMSGINLESFKTEMNNSFKGELSALKTEIEFLKAAPKGLSSQEIESLVQKMLMNVAGKADLDRLTQKIQTLENQLSSQQTSLSGLEGMTSTINDLKSQIEVLRKNAGSTESSQGQNLTRVDQKLASLEQSVNEMKNRHSVLENKISSLEGYGPRLENVEKKMSDHDNRLQELERLVKEQGNLIQELSSRPTVSPTVETPIAPGGFKKGNYEDFYIKTEKQIVGKQLFSPKQIENMCRRESSDQCRLVNCQQIYPGGNEKFCTDQCDKGQLMHDQRENLYKVCMSERLQHQSEGLSPDKRMEWKNSVIPSFEIAVQQKVATGQVRQETSDQRADTKRQKIVQPQPQPLMETGIPTLEVKGRDEELLTPTPSVGTEVTAPSLVSIPHEGSEQQLVPPSSPPPPPVEKVVPPLIQENQTMLPQEENAPRNVDHDAVGSPPPPPPLLPVQKVAPPLIQENQTMLPQQKNVSQNIDHDVGGSPPPPPPPPIEKVAASLIQEKQTMLPQQKNVSQNVDHDAAGSPPPPPVPVSQNSVQTPVMPGGFKKGNYEDFYIKTEQPTVGKQLFSPKQIEVMCRQESFDQCRLANCQQIYPGGNEKFCADQCTSGKLMHDQRENLYKVCMSERLQHQSEGLSPDKRMEWKNSVLPSFAKAAQQKIETGQIRQQTSAQRVGMKGQMPVPLGRPIVPSKKEQRTIVPQQQKSEPNIQQPTVQPISMEGTVSTAPPPPPPPPPLIQKVAPSLIQGNQTMLPQQENAPQNINPDTGGSPPPPPPPPPVRKVMTLSIQKNQPMLPQQENAPQNINPETVGSPPPPPPPPPPPFGMMKQNVKQPPVGLPQVSSKIVAPVGQPNRGALLDQIRSKGGQGLKKTAPNERKPLKQNTTGFNTGLADSVKKNAGNVQPVENPNTASVGDNGWGGN